MTLTNEPVTFNATEDSMSLVWGVTEELLRLADMHSGAAGGGMFGMGTGDVYDDEEGEQEEVMASKYILRITISNGLNELREVTKHSKSYFFFLTSSFYAVISRSPVHMLFTLTVVRRVRV